MLLIFGQEAQRPINSFKTTNRCTGPRFLQTNALPGSTTPLVSDSEDYSRELKHNVDISHVYLKINIPNDTIDKIINSSNNYSKIIKFSILFIDS